MKIETIGLNDFLKQEFDFCFCCGRKDFYIEFTLAKAFYRVCPDCLRKSKVKAFFKKLKEVR
jgi:hypothetical protein